MTRGEQRAGAGPPLCVVLRAVALGGERAERCLGGRPHELQQAGQAIVAFDIAQAEPVEGG